MLLQLAGVVIARQIQIVEPRNDSAIYNFYDVRFLQVLRHPTHGSAVFGKGRLAITLPVAFDHLRQIKIDLVTGSVLHQRYAIAVTDLTADGWNTDRRLRATANARGPGRPSRDLHPPESDCQRSQAEQHEQPQKLQSQERAYSHSVHTNPRRGRYG